MKNEHERANIADSRGCAAGLCAVQLELKRAVARSAELDAQLAELQRQNTELEEKQAHSRDDATIESIARERLGLVMPGEIVFYFISDRED